MSLRLKHYIIYTLVQLHTQFLSMHSYPSIKILRTKLYIIYEYFTRLLINKLINLYYELNLTI